MVIKYFNYPTGKGILPLLWLAVWLLLAQPLANAQQQTGQVIPETRNPQINSPELFQQQENIQTTESQQLLNQDKVIQIPTGVPVKNTTPSTDSETNIPWLLITSLALSLSACGYIWVRFKKTKTVRSVLEEDRTPIPAPVVKKTVKTKSKKSKKRKRR